jgi:hypothetical protein
LKAIDGEQIDLYEGDRINERALKTIVRAAVAHNPDGLKGKTPQMLAGFGPEYTNKRKRHLYR